MRLGKFGKLLHHDTTSLGVGNIRRFTIIELKKVGGIIVNTFNTVDQDRFHSHAFSAFSLMLKGYYDEEVLLSDGRVFTKRIERSRFIPKNYIHKITQSTPGAMSITFEGPWGSTWNEYFDDGRVKTYTWGRRVLFDSKYFRKSKVKKPLHDHPSWIEEIIRIEDAKLFEALGLAQEPRSPKT